MFRKYPDFLKCKEQRGRGMFAEYNINSSHSTL